MQLHDRYGRAVANNVLSSGGRTFGLSATQTIVKRNTSRWFIIRPPIPHIPSSARAISRFRPRHLPGLSRKSLNSCRKNEFVRLVVAFWTDARLSLRRRAQEWESVRGIFLLFNENTQLLCQLYCNLYGYESPGGKNWKKYRKNSWRKKKTGTIFIFIGNTRW